MSLYWRSFINKSVTDVQFPNMAANLKINTRNKNPNLLKKSYLPHRDICLININSKIVFNVVENRLLHLIALSNYYFFGGWKEQIPTSIYQWLFNIIVSIVVRKITKKQKKGTLKFVKVIFAKTTTQFWRCYKILT